MSVSNSCNDFGCLLSQIYSQMVVFSSSFLSHNSCLSHCCRSYSSLLLQSRPREWGEQLNTFQIQIYCCVFFDFHTIRDSSVYMKEMRQILQAKVVRQGTGGTRWVGCPRITPTWQTTRTGPGSENSVALINL